MGQRVARHDPHRSKIRNIGCAGKAHASSQ
jgi:hypothetical protein